MKHPYRRRLMYLGFQGLRVLAQRLPFSSAQALGRALGSVCYALMWSYRRLTLTHIQEAMGSTLTAAQRGRIARGVFLNLGQNAIEWMRLPKLSSKDLQELITADGIEHLRHARSKRTGAIVVSAHFGNWEFISVYLRSLGFEGGVLARRLRYAEYESFLISMRGDKGVPTLARGSIKDVARLLRDNQIVGVMPDQDIDSLEGVFINFFGRPAYTPVGPAALALMTGAPIIPCFMLREGPRFRLKIEPPVQPPQTRDRAQALAEFTQAWSQVLESYIRKHPDHWVWMHRRWKTQPSLSGSIAEPVRAGRPHDRQRGRRFRPARPGPDRPTIALLAAIGACAMLASGGCDRSAGPSARAPQEEMTAFTMSGYNIDGSKRWDLEGVGATIVGEMVTIRRPDGIGYEPERTVYLTASAAQVDQTNHHVRLEHDVTIHTSDGLWLSAPVLHWIPDEERMATDTAVRIEMERMVVWGRGLEGLAQLDRVTLLSDVEMVLSPRREDGTDGEHVTITCDGSLLFDHNLNIATFKKNVHVIDPGGELYADKLIAYLEPETHGIIYADALGRVVILEDQNLARSDRAIYEPATGKITLVGKPSLAIPSSDSEPGALEGLMGGLVSTARQRTAADGPGEEPTAKGGPALFPEPKDRPQHGVPSSGLRVRMGPRSAGSDERAQ